MTTRVGRWIAVAATAVAVVMFGSAEVKAGRAHAAPLAARPGSCAPLDIVLAIDSSTSMSGAIQNVKREVTTLIDRIVAESGGDYRIGLLDFADDVQVRVPFGDRNGDAVKAVIPRLYHGDLHNEGLPEAWDQALVTVVDGRTAAVANAAGAQDVQIGDFNADWRPEAKKMVLLVSDARPGGFDAVVPKEQGPDDVYPAANDAYAAATRAATKGIRIATVYVPNARAERTASGFLAKVSNLTGASALRSSPDGSNLTDGLDLMVATCAADSDGDGLFDTWETDGYDADGDGTVDVDLKAMGANPRHKDLFVQVNWMLPDGVQPCLFGIWCGGGTDNGHPPNPVALRRLVEVFAGAPVKNPDGEPGITVHLDAGGLEPISARIDGSDLHGGPLFDHVDVLDPYSEEARTARDRNVSAPRSAVVTWVLYGHQLAEIDSVTGTGPMGVAPLLPGDTVYVGTEELKGDGHLETVTLVHEIGHTLGLRHGGFDDAQPKPNYLSVMNYAVGFNGGLRREDAINIVDYSRFDTLPLDLDKLDEATGVAAATGSVPIDDYHTFKWCVDGEHQWKMPSYPIRPLDWNCDGDQIDSGVKAHIVAGAGSSVVSGRNDWATVTFSGGARGGLYNEGEETDESGFTHENWVSGDHPFGVQVVEPGVLSNPAGAELVRLPFSVINTGSEAAAWKLEAQVTGDWSSETRLSAESIQLEPRESETVMVDVSIPESASAGESSLVTLNLTSDDPQNFGGAATAEVRVGSSTETPASGQLVVEPAEPTTGETFTVRGAGFDPDAPIVIAAPDGLLDAVTAVADSSGKFNVDLTAPDAVGTQRIVAIGPGRWATPGTSTTTTALDDPLPTGATHPRVLEAEVTFVAHAEPESAAVEGVPLWVLAGAGAAVLGLLAAVLVLVGHRRRH